MAVLQRYQNLQFPAGFKKLAESVGCRCFSSGDAQHLEMYLSGFKVIPWTVSWILISSMVLVSEGAATSQRYVAVSIRVVFLITSDVRLRISARVAKSPDTEEREGKKMNSSHTG